MSEATEHQQGQTSKPSLPGAAAAFQQLALPLTDRVFSILAGMVGRTDAEDLLQETLLKAFRAFGSFRGDSTFDTWFLRIAVNTARNHISKKRPVPVSNSRSQGPDDPPADPLDSLTAAAADPLEALALAEDTDALRDAVGRMPHDEREVLLLREIQEMSYEEMAAAVGVSVGAVRSRLHRARRRLFALLGGREE